MILRLSPAQIAMAALCVLMALVFAYELAAPPAEFALPDVHLKPRSLIAAAPPVFAPPPSGAFSAINERPPFLPSRKPIAAPAAGPGAVPAGPPPLPNVSLVGVIMDGQNSLAMVRLAGAPFEQAMATGASIGQWQIATIAPDRIVLKSGTYTEDVRMDAHAAPPGPGTPGPAAPGTPQ